MSAFKSSRIFFILNELSRLALYSLIIISLARPTTEVRMIPMTMPKLNSIFDIDEHRMLVLLYFFNFVSF